MSRSSGTGFRFAFAYYADHSGGASVARLSVAHDITGAQIWTTAPVLMTFGQALARVGVLQVRRVRAASHPVSVSKVSSDPPDPYVQRPVP